jgi:rhodanese-related sulfurtransferase
MAPKPSFPASLLRTYTSLISQRTSQLSFQASRLFGLELQSQSQDAWRRHVEGVTRGIERMSGGSRLQVIPIPVRSQPGFGQRRWHSTDFQKSKAYEFDDVSHLQSLEYPLPGHHADTVREKVLAILETPSNSRLLIDVREPHEFEKNTIPTAMNIPVTSHPDALLLSEEEFMDEFGFAKPPLNKEMVFFCKAGVRSSAAAGIARQAGYVNPNIFTWRMAKC